MTATAFQVGDRVTVRKNDAHVTPGSNGVVIGHASETGWPLVEVEGRGRVSLLPDSLELIARLPAVRASIEESIVSVAQEAPKRRSMSPEARAKISAAQKERQRKLREANGGAPTTEVVPVVAGDDDAATIRQALGVAARRGLGATTLIELAQLLGTIESTA